MMPEMHIEYGKKWIRSEGLISIKEPPFSLEVNGDLNHFSLY